MSDTLPPERIREFIISAHGDLSKVQAMLAEAPELLTVEYDWGPSGLEDGLGAAAHMGNRAIAEFFLDKGLPLNICVAAMLGDAQAVNTFLSAAPALANARGAHGIPVMFHAAMSGDVSIAQTLHDHGCNEGLSSALHGAINFNHKDMVIWLLSNGADDLKVPNYEGKTPLTRALETDQTEIADLLRQHGATA